MIFCFSVTEKVKIGRLRGFLHIFDLIILMLMKELALADQSLKIFDGITKKIEKYWHISSLDLAWQLDIHNQTVNHLRKAGYIK